MELTHQIARATLGAFVSLLVMMTPVHAEEKGHRSIEYGITTYGIFSLVRNGAANDGKIFTSQNDNCYYAGWSGQGVGAGAGLGLIAMWRGCVGIDVQMLYTTHSIRFIQ